MAKQLFAIVRAAIGDTPNVTFFPELSLRIGGGRLLAILDLTAENMLEKLDSMDESDPYFESTKSAYEAVPDSVGGKQLELFRVGGGPGCGKTTVIKRICDTNELCTVMVPFKRLKEDYIKERCYTQHVAVSKKMQTEILLVDEFTGCDVGMVFATALNHGCSKIVLWGDVLQTWLQDAEGQGFKDLMIPEFARLRANYRNPGQDVQLLNKVFGDDMVATKKGSGIIVRSLYEDSIDEDGVNVTFSKESQRLLQVWHGIDVNTVRGVQGATFEKVNLFVFKRDLNMITNYALFRVAFSRHTHKLIVYCCEPRAVEEIVRSGKLANDKTVGLDAHDIQYNESLLRKVLRILGIRCPDEC